LNAKRYDTQYTLTPSVQDLARSPHSKATNNNPKVLVIGSNQDYFKYQSEFNDGNNPKGKGVNLGMCIIVKDAQFCVTPMKEHVYEGQVDDQM